MKKSLISGRKHGFDGVVMELAVPQYFETFFSRLSDALHHLPGEKRIVVVIPPYRAGYPSAEVRSHPKRRSPSSDT